MESNEELISWFTSKEWPATHHKISVWESSDNLAKSIGTMIVAIREGNKNSVEVLRRIKASLDIQSDGDNA